jgi:hypothetical protein
MTRTQSPEDIAQIPETRLLTEVDPDFARRAYEHISMRSKASADSQCAYVAQHFVAVRAELLIVATAPAQLAILDDEFPSYVDAYIRQFHRVLTVRSQMVSPHIAGESNFNRKRFARSLSSEQRAERDLETFDGQARAGMLARLKAGRSDDQRAEIAWVNLKRLVIECIATAEGIDAGLDGFHGFDRSAFVAAAAKSIRKAIDDGHKDAAAQALTLVRSRVDLGKRPLFRDRHPIWKTIVKDEAAS